MTDTFDLPALMAMLSLKAGLDPAAHTTDPDLTLEEIGLDSLAFLAVETELNDRYGIEFDADTTAASTLGELAQYVDERLAAASSAPVQVV